jgi:hypothetical protein
MFPLDYRKAGKSCPKTSTRSRKRLLGQSKMLLSWDSFFFRKWNKFRPIWKYAVPDVIEYYYILLHTLFLCTGKMFATYPFYIATPSNEMGPVQLLYLLFHY